MRQRFVYECGSERVAGAVARLAELHAGSHVFEVCIHTWCTRHRPCCSPGARSWCSAFAFPAPPGGGSLVATHVASDAPPFHAQVPFAGGEVHVTALALPDHAVPHVFIIHGTHLSSRRAQHHVDRWVPAELAAAQLNGGHCDGDAVRGAHCAAPDQIVTIETLKAL